MPAGRPTEYTPELVEEALAYLDDYKTKHSHPIPSVVGLCKIINITRTTAYDWEKHEDKEFSYILEKIATFQELDLVNGGLNSDLNPTITKLMLTKHGYHDKQDVDHSGGFSVTVPDTDAGTL